MSALATVAQKSFNGKLTAKIDFPVGHFMLPLLKYLDHMLVEFEQKPLVQTIQSLVLFDKEWLTIFEKVLTLFWKTFVSVTETIVWCLSINSKTFIFQCSKNYGTPTGVTRLKVKSTTFCMVHRKKPGVKNATLSRC